MAEKKQYSFKSPELHWFNNYLGSSDTLKRNTFVQNLHGIPVNQDNENRKLVALGNSSKRSSHLSHGGSPPRKGINIQNGLLVGIMNTALAPLERVSIMMRCQNEMIKAGRLSTPYIGMKDCFRRTIKHEGVISLWRGNSMNVIKICLIEAFPTIMYQLPYRNYMDTKLKESALWLLPFAVTPLMLCHYPLQYARVRLASDVKADGISKFSLDLSQNKISKRQFNGVIDVYKKTLQLDGIHGLYRGFSLSCVGLFAYCMAKWSLQHTSNKEKQKQKIHSADLDARWLYIYCLPVLFYPALTVSKRMMMTSGEASKYRGVMDAFYSIVKTEGVSSLFKGVTPYMIHSFAKNLVMLGQLSIIFSLLQKPAK